MTTKILKTPSAAVRQCMFCGHYDLTNGICKERVHVVGGLTGKINADKTPAVYYYSVFAPMKPEGSCGQYKIRLDS